ncbi:MAG: hypothetical protein K6B40_06455 [Firmicutes bacterium]|nr:hypothetical protein [Bacillota bacterium]
MTRPSKEVIARYQAKTYSRYHLTLRKDSDQQLIDHIEANKAAGISPTQTIRQLWEKANK